jgi:hypothetical protein
LVRVDLENLRQLSSMQAGTAMQPLTLVEHAYLTRELAEEVVFVFEVQNKNGADKCRHTNGGDRNSSN